MCGQLLRVLHDAEGNWQMTRRIAIGCVGLLIVMSGCSKGSDNLLPRCETVRSLQVRDSGEHVLWRIETAEPREICEITYGQTPTHFVQMTPARGSPRTFVMNERLTVERITADGWVRTDCSAVTKRTIICAGYIAGRYDKMRSHEKKKK